MWTSSPIVQTGLSTIGVATATFFKQEMLCSGDAENSPSKDLVLGLSIAEPNSAPVLIWSRFRILHAVRERADVTFHVASISTSQGLAFQLPWVDRPMRIAGERRANSWDGLDGWCMSAFPQDRANPPYSVPISELTSSVREALAEAWVSEIVSEACELLPPERVSEIVREVSVRQVMGG